MAFFLQRQARRLRPQAVLPWAIAGLLILLCPVGRAQQTSPAKTIDEITITGNHRIPEETILGYIQGRKGQVFDEEKARADYRALLGSGLFSDVRLSTEARGEDRIALVFQVTEPLLIEGVVFKGLKAVEEAEILDQFRQANSVLTPGSPIDESKLARALRVVRLAHEVKGFPEARVTIKREPAGAGAVKLVFEVDQGPRVRIGAIEFEGNKVLTDSELRDALKLTRETSLIARLKRQDRYIQERLRYDLQANALPRYQARGYIFARIGEPRVEIVAGPEYRITVPVVEGEQFRYSSFHVEGAQKLDPARLRTYYSARPGQAVDYVSLAKTNDEVKRMYAALGYLDMEVIPEIRPQYDKATVDATIRIREGGRYFVGEINFRGNEKTRDKVLRRAFLLEEQELFNGDLLDASIQRLNVLGFVEAVTDRDYELKKDPAEGQVDILVRVKEKDERAINLNGGLGGISGSYIGVNFQSRNFRGLGQTVELQVATGNRTSNYSLSWTDPYWLDMNFSLGLLAFNRRLRFDTLGFLPGQRDATDAFSLFSQCSTGFQATTSHPVTASNRLGASYSLDTNRISDIREDFRSYAVAQLVLLSAGGTVEEALSGIVRSQLGPFWRYDTRDRLFGARRGAQFIGQVPVSGGPFGGRIKVSHPLLEYQKFVPDRLFGASRNTWAFRAELEHVFAYGKLANGAPRPVPFLERIYFGGEYNLRGFDLRSVGPVAIRRTPEVDSGGNPVIDPETGLQKFRIDPVAIGGDTGLVLTTEYRIPIYGPLQITPFLDFGGAAVVRKRDLRLSTGAEVELIEETNRVWRMSTGTEIQFFLPVIDQPFRLILAYNPLRLNKQLLVDGQSLVFKEPRTNLKFSIGWSF